MKQFLIASLFILIGADSYSQYQTKKGHWILTHTVVNGGPVWYHTRNYENGVLETSYKGKETNFYAAFNPTYGGLESSREKYLNEKPAYVKTSDASFQIEPQAGYFIKDNLMIGAAFIAGFSFESEKEEGDVDRSRTWHIGAGPIARYYFGNKKKHRAFVGLESRAFIQTKNRREKYITNNKLEEYKEDGDAVGFRVKPYVGYALFLGKHWTADAHIGFLYDKSDYETVYKSYTDKVIKSGYPYRERSKYDNKTLSLNIGIAYTF